jgi:TorA maturation chaperone TorD
MIELLDSPALTARAEFFLCLSRALLTPTGDEALAAMRDALPVDLEELVPATGYSLGTPLAAYRGAIAAIESPVELLQQYSSLFLVAPRHAHINTATYLDGSINGGSVTEIEIEYRRHGVERSDELKDLSDHVAVQLEFLAYLFAKAAEEREAAGNAATGDAPAVSCEDDARIFLHQYVARWLGPWMADIDKVGREAGFRCNPYLELARVLEAAAVADARAPDIPAAELRAQRAITRARQQRAARGVTAEDMETIARKLREKGLSTDHLAIAPEDRDAAMGMTKKVPPSPRRGSRFG